jgi:hypothetical protein
LKDVRRYQEFSVNSHEFSVVTVQPRLIPGVVKLKLRHVTHTAKGNQPF